MTGRESPRESLLPGAQRPFDVSELGGPPSPVVTREAPSLMRNPSNSALRGKASRESDWDEIEQNLALLVVGSGGDVDFLVERVKRSLGRLRERSSQQSARHSTVSSRLEIERESGSERRKHLERELNDVQMRLQRKDAEIQLQLQEDDNQIAELNAKLEKKEQQLRRQECELKEANRQCKEVRLQREELDRRLVMTQDEQRLSSERHAAQWREMATKTHLTQEELARRSGELENTRADADEYTKRLSQKDAEIEELQSTIDVSLEQVHKLRSDEARLCGQQSQASSLGHSMRDRSKAMRSELETVHEENEKLEGKNFSKAKQLEETIGARSMLSEKLANTSQMFERSSMDNSAKARIRDLEDTLIRTRSDATKLTHGKTHAREAVEKERRELKEKSTKLQKDLDMTREDLLKVQQTCFQAEKEIRADQGSLKSQVEQMRKKVAESEMRALETQTAVTEKERRNRELKRHVAQQESNEIQRQKTDVPENRSTQVSALQQKLDEALAQGDSMRETIQEIERRGIKSRIAQEALQCDFQRYQSIMQSSGRTIPEELSGKIIELTRHAEQVEKELSTQRKEILGIRAAPLQGSVPNTLLAKEPAEESSVNQIVDKLLNQARREVDTSGDGDYGSRNSELMYKMKELESQISTLTTRNENLEAQIHSKVEPMQVEDDRRSQAASGISGQGGAYTATSGEKHSVLEHTDGILQGARLALSRLNKAEKNYRRLGGMTKPSNPGAPSDFTTQLASSAAQSYTPSASSRGPQAISYQPPTRTSIAPPIIAIPGGSPNLSPVSSPRPSYVPPIVASPAAPPPAQVQVAPIQAQTAPASHTMVATTRNVPLGHQMSSPQLSPRGRLPAGQPMQSPRLVQHNFSAGQSFIIRGT